MFGPMVDWERYGIERSHHRRTGPLAVTETAPTICPAGHRLGPDRVLVGNHPCGCRSADGGPAAHRTWRCRTCDACWVWPPCTDRPRWIPWPGDPPA